ncbi:hypothetical protein BPODLACK_01190 [Gordonia sp. YY1]|nr:hypothetical protein BPODLACK_01190 [Gordonia sp. YY1]
MTYQPPPPGGAPPPFGPGRPGQGPQWPGPGGRQPGGPRPGQFPPGQTPPAPQPRPPYGPYGPPPPYGAYGPGPYAQRGGHGGPPGGPYGPPPPRRNAGVIVAWITGGVAVVALVALVVTLMVTSSGPDESTVATGSSTSSNSSPDGSASTADESESESADHAALSQIRAALQNYVSARNARDVVRMKAAVCTQSRDRITGPPPDDDGNIVVDGFLGTVFDGDVAQSEVVSHLEKGNQRTESEKSKERFLKERGSWIYCPDAEPDIGA